MFIAAALSVLVIHVLHLFCDCQGIECSLIVLFASHTKTRNANNAKCSVV